MTTGLPIWADPTPIGSGPGTIRAHAAVTTPRLVRSRLTPVRADPPAILARGIGWCICRGCRVLATRETTQRQQDGAHPGHGSRPRHPQTTAPALSPATANMMTIHSSSQYPSKMVMPSWNSADAMATGQRNTGKMKSIPAASPQNPT
jgi:hypothetical protein